MKLSIVTGGSKGLGEALCLQLEHVGHQVVQISRSMGLMTEKIKSYQWDFAQPDPNGELINQIFDDFPMNQFDSIHLINNAAVNDPICMTPEIQWEKAQWAMKINLISPIMFTAQWLKALENFSGNRMVVNISSGAAPRPLAGWTIYSAAKAGIDNFSKSLIDEYKSDTKMQVINFYPGIIDTGMQTELRSVTKNEFPEIERFKEFKFSGQLRPPKQVGRTLAKLINGDLFTKEDFVSISDFD